MEALLTHTAVPTPLPESDHRSGNVERKSSRVATLVAAIYIALLASTPLIVRYGPAPDDHAVEALATRIDLPRCTSTSAPGLRCKSWTTAASPRGRAGDI